MHLIEFSRHQAFLLEDSNLQRMLGIVHASFGQDVYEISFSVVLATGKKRVGVLGFSFKAGTDDLRESPIVTLVERLIGKGMQLAIYDGHVSRANLIGANREYIENEIPHIWTLMKNTVEEVVDFGDCVAIGNGTPEFRQIQPTLRDGQIVVDLVRAFGSRTSDASYQGVAW